MNHTTPQSIPPGWLEAIEESDAQLAAGQVVPLPVVLAELEDSVAQIEAKLAANPAVPKAVWLKASRR